MFVRALAARKLGAAAQEVADRWFLENLVRIHRAGDAGRSYIEAYVNFFKFAEGHEHDHQHAAREHAPTGHDHHHGS